MSYPVTPEIVLSGLAGDLVIPELTLSYARSSGKVFSGSIRSAADIAEFLKATFAIDEIELQEQFVVLYLSQKNDIIGYYRHSRGGITATVADIRLIVGAALRCAAVSLVVAHNHPSGALKESEADRKLTEKLRDAVKLMDIRLLDHLILTKNGYLSFAEQGLLGLAGLTSIKVEEPEHTNRTEDSAEFLRFMQADLRMGYQHNKRSMERLAEVCGIRDRNKAKELTELAVVLRARELAHAPGDTLSRYLSIVDLYEHQANLSHRTSNSILLQQYSTPAPIAFLAGVFCGLNKERLFHLDAPHFSVFEPSAGNGLLTVAAKPHYCTVNEIDELRRSHLMQQGFRKVTALDAAAPFPVRWHRRFDAILTNPPFGTVDIKVDYDGYKIGSLEQVMALRALDCMADNGSAAVIIGGHTQWDKMGRIQAGKNRVFFHYLYTHYKVEDVINIDGQKLYSRQGTSFDVRLILISRRKSKPSGVVPLHNPDADQTVRDFDTLFARVMAAMGKPVHSSALPASETPQIKPDMSSTKSRALALELEMDMERDGLKGTGIAGSPAAPVVAVGFNSVQRQIEVKAEHPLDAVTSTGLNLRGYAYSDGTWYQPVKDAHRIPELTADLIRFLIRRGYMVVDKSWEGLGMAYAPASDIGKSLQTQVPDSMGFETHEALRWIQEEVGGDVDNFVRDRLGYTTLSELGQALSAEQIDAVAMAIFNIEGRRQGMIIGDQTGIGKGRVAAAIIRYACKQGIRPIFLTEKPNLFSDIYRDLKAIGSSALVPFIVNGKESKTDIKDEDGNVIYTALTPPEQQTIFERRSLPERFDFAVATYSQFNSPETKPLKPAFLQAIAADTIMILDEAHNSSGSSNTGAFLKGVVKSTKGVIFLSATFAKRPDNMPIYAMKTCMADCALSDDGLVNAIEKGGVALQEVISAQLVSEGQMLRRERSYEGIEVNYLTMNDQAQEHRATADIVTAIIRRIIAFQIKYVESAVREMDKIVAAESKEVGVRTGTEQAGVDNTPYFSKVFNVINQMLFAIKAEAVADRAILRLQEGKKPVIAFSSTMGAFLETMENERGLFLSDGDVIKADFSEVLKRGLDGVMKITVRDERGNPSYERLPLEDLSQDGITEYHSILSDIEKVATGLCISPIDILIEKIERAGYSVAEVTGRRLGLRIGAPEEGSRLDLPRTDAASRLRRKTQQPNSPQLNGAGVFPEHQTDVPEVLDFRPPLTGTVYVRKRENTNDAFRRFNNNEVDVLLINQSGSTGASAHAIPTARVPAHEVRQRVMIVLQAELDINTEVQKRGRINRTGQILKPIYDYLTSAIPAEQRLMMMLQKKLKSLDANTSSNQKQSSSILDVPDFLNKYGDKVVKEYLMDNPDINSLLDDPLKLSETGDEDRRGNGDSAAEDAAQKVSGRVAVLSTDMQKAFYDEISERYNDFVGYLKQAGEYDLELEAMNLQAETVRSSVISVGTGGGSPFGENVNLNWSEVNVLRKPYTVSELSNLLNDALAGQDALAQQQLLQTEFQVWQEEKLKAELSILEARYQVLLQETASHRTVRNAPDEESRAMALEELQQKVVEAKVAATRKAEQKSRNIGNSLTQYFRFFHIGRYCMYPLATMGVGVERVPAVFIGFIIDRRKANPFAPSAVKLRFAVASGLKYLELPASMQEQISPIVAASVHTVQPPSLERLLEAWGHAIASVQAARKKRYIITGNLLQALGTFKGRLIDYTTMNGGNEKGLLMPESWSPDERGSGGDKVSVPLAKAVRIIRSMPAGTNYKCSNGLIIAKEYNQRFKLYVPASRQGGGSIYLDPELHALIDKSLWEKLSDKMIAFLQPDRMEAFLHLIGERHPGTVSIARHQIHEVDSSSISEKQRRHYTIRLPEPAPAEVPQTKPAASDILIRALALELEMEMELELAA